MMQQIQSLHVPPCHRHMVIATRLSVLCFAFRHSANQTCHISLHCNLIVAVCF